MSSPSAEVNQASQVATPGRLCAECGLDNPATARFCFCGHNLVAPPLPPPPVGVGGWLLFLCLQLAVLNPAVIGLQVAADFQVIVAGGLLWSRIGMMALLDATIRALLVLAGFISTILLFKHVPLAVRVTQTVLIASAVSHFLLVGLPFALGVPEPGRLHIAGAYMYRAAQLVLWTGFWVIYLSKSRRVRATYGGRTPVGERR